MARRKPARVHGITAIDKPAGMSSRAVVNALSRHLGERRCGHAGTLDPDATGVLVLAFGEATKAVRWLMSAPKSYRAQVCFGAATTTDDAAGAVVATAPLPEGLNAAALAEAVTVRPGFIEQRPPAVSALKRGGVRDHERVRRGEMVRREPRPVWLQAVRVLEVDDTRATLAIDCGSGFYVRAWARDLGEALGTLAHLADLRRTRAGGFELASCTPLSALLERAPAEVRACLEPIAASLGRVMPRVVVHADAEQALRLGRRVPLRFEEHRLGAEVCVVNVAGAAVCVASVVPDPRGAGLLLKVSRGFSASPLGLDAIGQASRNTDW